MTAGKDGTIIVRVNAGDFHVTKNEGRTWARHPFPPSPQGAPAGSNVGENILAVTKAGHLVFASTLMTDVQAPMHQVVKYEGLHLATSEDDGATWRSNNFLRPRVHGQDAGADRPWLTVAPDDTVYLTYHAVIGGAYQWLPTGGVGAMDTSGPVVVQRSDDQGVSWSPPVEVGQDGVVLQSYVSGQPTYVTHGVTTNGHVAVDGEGRVFVALHSQPSPSVFVANGVPSVGGVPENGFFGVAVSEDRGATFEVLKVGNVGQGTWAPSVTVDATGVVHAAAKLGGRLLVSSSANHGRTWTEATQWNQGEANFGVRTLAGPFGVSVAWYEMTEDGFARLQFARQQPGHPTPGPPVDLSVTITSSRNAANSDFAYFDLLPDGRMAAVWSDEAAQAVFLVVEELVSSAS